MRMTILLNTKRKHIKFHEFSRLLHYDLSHLIPVILKFAIKIYTEDELHIIQLNTIAKGSIGVTWLTKESPTKDSCANDTARMQHHWRESLDGDSLVSHSRFDAYAAKGIY